MTSPDNLQKKEDELKLKLLNAMDSSPPRKMSEKFIMDDSPPPKQTRKRRASEAEVNFSHIDQKIQMSN
jgi:hypothetical protein